MMRRTIKIILILAICFLSTKISAQEAQFFDRLDSNQRYKITKNIFDEIESGISSGEAANISPFLSSQTYLSFSNGINGYYSPNQTYYILEDYFKIYKVISFKLQNVKINETVPYATGIYYFEHRGKRGSARVYISLNRSGKNWKISQLTIN